MNKKPHGLIHTLWLPCRAGSATSHNTLSKTHFAFPKILLRMTLTKCPAQPTSKSPCCCNFPPKRGNPNHKKNTENTIRPKGRLWKNVLTIVFRDDNNAVMLDEEQKSVVLPDSRPDSCRSTPCLKHVFLNVHIIFRQNPTVFWHLCIYVCKYEKIILWQKLARKVACLTSGSRGRPWGPSPPCPQDLAIQNHAVFRQF